MHDSEGPLSLSFDSPEENAVPTDPVPIPVSHPDPLPHVREIVSLLLMVVLADLTIYHGQGYGGLALLLAVAPLLLLIGSPHHSRDRSVWLLGGMLLLVAARLLWCGFPLALVVGGVLLPCFSMALNGRTPHVPEAFAFLPRVVYYGARGFTTYEALLRKSCRRFTYWNWLAVFLPVGVGALFSILFVLANPDLVKSFHVWLSDLVEWMQHWFDENRMWEVVFWGGVTWIAIGLLRPFGDPHTTLLGEKDISPERSGEIGKTDPLFTAFRNTLLLVILLFGSYLAFEFQTLWFRSFPKGFYYSGYAHEGAAWLTVALALATALLSLIFRGRVLRNPKLVQLRILARIWSVENLLLAVAVYHRLTIYVGFNGMTWLRFVGFYGVTTVVAGFLIVLWKISRQYNFVWLIRRQLWALAIAVFLYAITPVDYLAMRYNARQIVAGDPKPAVQISVQPMSSEGILALNEVFRHADLSKVDPVIVGGIAALNDQIRQKQSANSPIHWTAYQISENLLHRRLKEPSGIDRAKKDWEAFRNHVYQWY